MIGISDRQNISKIVSDIPPGPAIDGNLLGPRRLTPSPGTAVGRRYSHRDVGRPIEGVASVALKDEVAGLVGIHICDIESGLASPEGMINEDVERPRSGL